MAPIERVDVIRFLFEEKRERRTEMVAYQQGQQNAILALVVFCGGLAGLYANPTIIGSEELRATVIFIATQIIYFVSMYILSQFGVLVTQAGYVAAIERNINDLAGRKLALWENIGSMRHAWRGPMALAFLVMACLMMGAWICCILLVIRIMPQVALITVIGIETILAVGIAFWAMRANRRVAREMLRDFNVTGTAEANKASPATSEPTTGADSSTHQG